MIKARMPAINNRGFTVIELLAALTITIAVLAVFFGALQNSINAYDRTTTHNRLRQEANLILANLTEVQRKWPLPYEMKVNNGTIELIGDSANRTLSSSEFDYSVTINGNTVLSNSSFTVNQSGYRISLTVQSKQHGNESYTLSTSIDRLKGG